MPYLYVVIVAVAIGAFLILKRRLAHYVAWTVMVLGMAAGCARHAREEIIACDANHMASFDLGSSDPKIWGNVTVFVTGNTANGPVSTSVPVEFSGSIATAHCPMGAPSVIFVVEGGAS